MSVNVFLDDILGTTENFVAKLGLEMQHHEPESCEKNWFTHQGHSEGLYTQNLTFSALSSKLLVCLQPN